MTRQEVIKRILAKRKSTPKASGAAFAPSNIALVKYWGKRNEELNLPVTSSLSVSLGTLGARTEVTLRNGPDVVLLNDEEVPRSEPLAQRVIAYLDLFRITPQTRYHVSTHMNLPVAAGLASSAAGFAALAGALNDLFGWQLGERELSILARLGSGSACRSVLRGFVHWHAGVVADGMDSYAEALPIIWPELRLGLLVLAEEQKPISSRQAMKQTMETSALYAAWPGKVKHDLGVLLNAIAYKDFRLLGQTAESNAMAMHASMLAAWPPILYWVPGTVKAIRRIWELRARGLHLFFTMDAGPNIKLLFVKADQPAVQQAFPDVQVVDPFAT